MSLIQCKLCGCVDNTAYATTRNSFNDTVFDWPKDLKKGESLCCACSPKKYLSTGRPYTTLEGFPKGEWHNKFTRTFLPKGMFFTNVKGNLSHKETLEEDYTPYILEREEGK